jgi:hypothetical protein
MVLAASLKREEKAFLPCFLPPLFICNQKMINFNKSLQHESKTAAKAKCEKY